MAPIPELDFQTDTADYERWLRQQCQVVEPDLAYKHTKMRTDPFVFLRATYYRWATGIERLLPELRGAPAVLAVGDAHTENFGTWRDADGRLVWGINDFDDAATMPYPFDLVRLATSVRLIAGLDINNHDVADALLKGYRRGLTRPRPALLDEGAVALRSITVPTDTDRDAFWVEVAGYADAAPPANAEAALRASLPPAAAIVRFASRRKGSGGLGRPRYVAIAAWQGGQLVREAKALVASAWDWAHEQAHVPSQYMPASTGRYRSPDPFLGVDGGYVVRRVAADADKLDLAELHGPGLTLRLLVAMGWDIGAIHAADPAAAAIGPHLDRQPPGWLHDAAKRAAAAVQQDFLAWQRVPPG